jgi:hypothetical protein
MQLALEEAIFMAECNRCSAKLVSQAARKTGIPYVALGIMIVYALCTRQEDTRVVRTMDSQRRAAH